MGYAIDIPISISFRFTYSVFVILFVCILSQIYWSQYRFDEKDPNLKYILQWTSPDTTPFIYMGKGRRTFLERHCPFTNCFVTPNRYYFNDYTKFDVIAFAGTELYKLSPQDMPQKRAVHQKYVFASVDSAQYYPAGSDWNGYFNWTWTYKLGSDSRWGFIIIRDSNNSIVGPKEDITWMRSENMEPVSDGFKDSLRRKTKAAAWFVSNCDTRSSRENYVRLLKVALKKYNLSVDVYGRCGPLACVPTDDDPVKCDKIIETEYFFYIAFENAFSEDYVTEKILHALKFNAVPIVYGGANYTRFMPDGIYLDATKLRVLELAAKMYELIHDIDQYAEYFKWKKYYSYHAKHEVPETDDYCGICALLNNEEMVDNTKVYDHFQEWWDDPSTRKGVPYGVFSCLDRNVSKVAAQLPNQDLN